MMTRVFLLFTMCFLLAASAYALSPAFGFIQEQVGDRMRVEFEWDENSETDLAGYSMYRGLVSGIYEKINNSELIPSATYTDEFDNPRPLLSGSYDGEFVSLSWSGVGEASYTVERSADAEGWATIGTVQQPGFLDARPNDGTRWWYRVTADFGFYYYVVTASNTAGMESGFSNEVSIARKSLSDEYSIVAGKAPDAPTGLRVVASGVNVSADWDTVPSVTHYGVFFKTATETNYTLIGVVDVSNWAGRLLPPGQRRGAELGVASLTADGFSLLTTHTFQ